MYATKSQVAFLLLFYAEFSSAIKTCSTWTDYWNFFGDNTCVDNLDANDEFVGIVERWGKKVESHIIQTYDGYYLTLFRIVSDMENASPVLLLHGIFMNSVAMVDRGPKSLAYPFVDKGYDVWILNWRGTKYSKKHIALSPNDGQYWKFSFNEWGMYDLPQALQEIKQSNHQKVLIVAFSYGSTAALVYMSLYPEQAEKNLKGVVSLSPTGAHMDVGFAVKMQYYLVPYLYRETLPVIVAQNKDSNSVMLFEHLYQMMRSRKFQQYDYGKTENVAKYGGETPAEYDLSKIKVPQLFYVGRNDKAGTLQDSTVLYQHIPEEYRKEFYVIENPKFGLADFVQAKDVNQQLHMNLMSSVTQLMSPAVYTE